jgi:hypothetical protein
MLIFIFAQTRDLKGSRTLAYLQQQSSERILTKCEVVHIWHEKIGADSRGGVRGGGSNSTMQQCAFCKIGGVSRVTQQLAFRQWTDRGYVSCQVEIVVEVCDRCGAKSWDEDAEAIIEKAVRQEYEKLR